MSAAKSSYYTTRGEEEESEEETEEEDEIEESEESSIHPPPLPPLVAGRYSILGEIGSGSYSEVYMGSDEQTGEQVAIKVEWQKAEKGDKLLGEGKLYEDLGKSGREAPHIRWIGTEGQYNMMVMDLLGPSLDMYFKHCGKFSLKTTVLLAEQLIDRLEYVHECGILYRDIKPHNFLMGLGDNLTRVYIVDFGLAKKYINKQGEHIACSKKKKSGVTGTVRYSSINVHEGLDASRRDDLEATGYMLVHFLRGDLPWLGLKAKSKRSKHKAIGNVKMETSDEDLCRGFPDEFCEFLRYCRKLDFAEKPDYGYLRDLFRKLFAKQGFENDGKFDWTNMKLPPPGKKISSREARKAREKAEKEKEDREAEEALRRGSRSRSRGERRSGEKR